MYLYLPAWLNLEKIFQAALDSGSIKPIKKDHLFYILNLFVILPARHKDLLDENGFFPLSSVLLQKYVHNYKQYLEFLIKERIILPSSGKYLAGYSSKKYKLIIPDTGDLTPMAIKATDRVLKRKYVRFFESKNEVKAIHYLTKWLEEPGLEVAFDEAMDYNHEVFKRKMLTNDWDQIILKNGKLKRKHPKDQFFYNQATLLKLKNREIYTSIDPTGHRLHTNLTSLKKNLRYFLRYKGQQLGAIDIKNCQPYLTLALLNRKFWNEDWKDNLTIKSSNNKILEASSIIMLVENLHDTNNQELKRFRQIVISGELYECFADELSRELDQDFSRKQAKLEMLRVFFTDNRYFAAERAKPKKIFAKMFPTIYQIYCEIKRDNKPMLAVLLQQLESFLVVHVICKRISEESPHIPLFTIHDSIVTTMSNLHTVKQIMAEELQKFVGHPPSLTIEPWELP